MQWRLKKMLGMTAKLSAGFPNFKNKLQIVAMAGRVKFSLHIFPVFC
jgi:hypothetical protein